MKLKRFGVLFFSLILGAILLVGCSNDNKEVAPEDDNGKEDVVSKDNTKDVENKDGNKEEGNKEEGNSEVSKEEDTPKTTEEFLAMYDEATAKEIVDTYGKDNYDYSLYVDSKEKMDFYKTNEIFSGEEKTQAEDTYFIYYYSPKCVYCQEFYSTLVDYTKKENAYPIYKVNIDIIDNYTAFVDAEIQGTPTLKLYNKKEDKVALKFEGVQSLESLPVILE